jgi:AGCS family alanine or glycine:cation symporter
MVFYFFYKGELEMETVSQALEAINHYVWGVPTLVLLVGTGILLTVRLRGLQFVKLWHAHKLAFGKSQDKSSAGDISHFQALMTAMAATIGTGNIAGVATAVSIGGPGAVFWMWITALFGMATKYAEAILAVKYRIKGPNGEFSGGPMYYLERGLGQKWLAVLFAIFGTTASFGIGNMVQSNSVAEAMKINFSISPVVSGLFMAVFVAFVILGGVKKIGKVTGYFVPVKAFFYIIAGLVIIFYHIDQIPAAFSLIFSGAFNGTAAVGGFVGAGVAAAIQKGVARGVFANEAGLGSAPIAAAAAKTEIPAKQALVSMTGTFLDTFVVCTITGLVLITTGAWKSGKTGVEATTIAFQSVFGSTGSMILGIAIVLFAFSTMLGWSYYGEKCAQYLFGQKAARNYRYIFVAMVALGANLKLGMVWTFADIANGLMAIPNLIGLVGLSSVVVAETRHFLQAEKSKTPHKDIAS